MNEYIVSGEYMWSFKICTSHDRHPPETPGTPLLSMQNIPFRQVSRSDEKINVITDFEERLSDASKKSHPPLEGALHFPFLAMMPIDALIITCCITDVSFLLRHTPLKKSNDRTGTTPLVLRWGLWHSGVALCEQATQEA